MIIDVLGCFEPICQKQLDLIKIEHRKNPDAIFVLHVDMNSPLAVLNLFAVKKMDYCVLTQESGEKVLDLHDYDTPLSMDNLPKFPRSVVHYIMHNSELLKELIRPMIKEKRYLHSLSVASTSEKLALLHHVDPNKAYICGLLHDALKDYDEAQNDDYLRHYDPDKLSYPSAIKHGYAMKYYLMEKAGYHDKDVLNAIYHHSDGGSRQKLAIILYIADKREPLRHIDDGILEKAETDLYRAFSILKKEVHLYLESKNERIAE